MDTYKFIDKLKKKYLEKYTYDKTVFVDYDTPVILTCLEHGDFNKTPRSLLYKNSGCNKCNGIVTNTEEFIFKARQIQGDKYDYSKSIYVNSKTPIIIGCPIHGEYIHTPNKHLSGRGCPKCSYESKHNKFRLNYNEVIDRFNKVHGDNYDYSLVNYVNYDTKVKIICPEHGVFEQTPHNHMSGQGCPLCKWDKIVKSKTFIDEKYLIKKYNKIHKGYYDYSKFIFYGRQSDKKSTIICPIHGEFMQNPFNHLNGQGCPHCGVRYSKQEEFIEQYLKINSIKYIRSDRTRISPLELDFYLPDYNIAIETNGTYWHSELKGKGRKYHLNKTNLCKEQGIQLIHINEYEFINSLIIVKSKLNSIFNINKRKLYARKCEVREIGNSLKSKFLKKYHLQGNDSSFVKLGLFYNNKLVSVMTFCKRRIALGKKSSGEGEYELSRFCNNFNFYVIGGASKLLKYFERNYNPKKIKTYADKRWSTGDVYFKLGFKHTHDSKPNYWYFYTSNTIYHRFNFRKSELSKKLEDYDETKSEWENMKANGWNRIWDCGTMVFEKNLNNE